MRGQYFFMDTQKETIPLFFSVDDGYVPFLAVALKSIIDNASKDYNYEGIVLHEGISKQNQAEIAAITADNFSVKFVSMKGKLNEQMKGEQAKLRGDYFTFTIFFRLFIADMFPEYDKAIYLDADIIVPGDVSELYNIELGSNVVGAISDLFISKNSETIEYSESAMGVPITDYVNSGVLLMNLAQLRKTSLSQVFLRLYNKYHFETIAPDQDYLNVIGHDKIKHLGFEWNTQTAALVHENEVATPKIIHYNLFRKPWYYKHVIFEDYFWKYAKSLGYESEFVEMQNNYSQEQAVADQDNLTGLLSMAAKIDDGDITFKKIQERGEQITI